MPPFVAMGLSFLEVLLLLSAAFVYLQWRRKRSSFPLPPGPLKLPLVGSMFSFPSQGFVWEVYEQWGKKYNSDVLYFSVPGSSLVILNSAKAVHDLFDSRSALYSSRPRFTFVNEFLGFKWMMAFMRYGEEWNAQRRYFQRNAHPKHDSVTGQVAQLATEHARRLALDLIKAPEDYLNLIHQSVCSVLHTAAYGASSAEDKASHFAVAGEVMHGLSDASVTIASLAESASWILPLLPRSMLPAAYIKGKKYWDKLHRQYVDEPFELAQISQNESFVSRCLAEVDPSQDLAAHKTHIKNTAAVFFIGGTSSTVAFMHVFILAMVAYPECQARAQAEIDAVIGKNRLPELLDQDKLPYLSAIYKEVHRWRPVGPIAMPHYLESDDVYNGYLIPGGSTVIGNAWAILHNEEDYPDPDTFNPGRYLKNGKIDTSVRDPTSIVFGFGRRVCPGDHISQVIIWMQMATILSNFSVSPATDEEGNVQMPSMEFKDGITVQPVPFKCQITPRHANVAHLLREALPEDLI